MENLTYRTDDLTRWGTGQGSNLAAQQVDRNFFALFSAISALEDHLQDNATIVSMHAVADQLFITLSNDAVIGPVTIPTSNWHYRGDGWLPSTSYAKYDVFSRGGAAYIVLFDHISGTTFNAGATDLDGNEFYGTLIATPETAIPEDGTVGQRLVHGPGSPSNLEWKSDKVRLSVTCIGQPSSLEVFFHYPVTDHLTMPATAEGSSTYQGIQTESDVSWTLVKNNATLIGSVDFTAAGDIFYSFPADVDFEPGDTISLYGPEVPDGVQANIAFTFVLLLTE